jgi:hypothetical protein
MSRNLGYACVAGWLTGLAAGGCAPLGFFVNLFVPPAPVAATYKLPADKKVLIFVDDPSGMVADQGVQEKLSEYLRSEFIANKVARTLTSDSALHAALLALGDDGNVGLGKISREVGADVVVYVHIEGFSLTDDEARTWQGKLTTAVRVRDSRGKALWPDAGQYRVEPVAYRPKQLIDDEVACKDHITDEMAKIAADRIAKLFYDHKGRELGQGGGR